MTRQAAILTWCAALLALAGTSFAAPAKKEKVKEEVAVIDTNLGRIAFRFFPQESPRTVEAFKARVRAGIYDGTLFHRVLPGLMLEGGDLQTREDGQSPGDVAPLEIEKNDLKHHIGTVSMA